MKFTSRLFGKKDPSSPSTSSEPSSPSSSRPLNTTSQPRPSNSTSAPTGSRLSAAFEPRQSSLSKNPRDSSLSPINTSSSLDPISNNLDPSHNSSKHETLGQPDSDFYRSVVYAIHSPQDPTYILDQESSTNYQNHHRNHPSESSRSHHHNSHSADLGYHNNQTPYKNLSDSKPNSIFPLGYSGSDSPPSKNNNNNGYTPSPFQSSYLKSDFHNTLRELMTDDPDDSSTTTANNNNHNNHNNNSFDNRDKEKSTSHKPPTSFKEVKCRLCDFKKSFAIVDKGVVEGSDELTNIQKGTIATANAQLVRGLKPRHMQMIAFGGAIGTGLFIRSGSSLANGGPAALIIGFSLTGIMLMLTIQALGELSVLFPVSGSFSTYASRFMDPAWGFAMGWNYALQWLIVFPLELVAAAITIQYWSVPGETSGAANVNPAAWCALFIVVIICFNIFGVQVYGEIEFVFSILKITAIIGFIILGIILTAGGGPNGSYIGTKYWTDPGAFANGFKGVIAAFVSASFSYLGTELAGLAAAEAKNPRRAIPSAVKQVCWRIILFYIVSLVIVGCLVPYTDPRLLDAKSSVDISTSPFVIAIKNAGISGLPSVFNAVILIAVLSVGNSAVYAASRTLAGLAAMGQAPKQFGYIDKAGRPIYALLLTFAFGLLAFVAASGHQKEAFNWLLSLSGLSSIFTWTSICLSHVRFRQGLKRQGRDLSELAFKAPLGIWGSLIGAFINLLILCLLFWVALFPLGAPSADAKNFFETYLAAPIILLFYIPYKLYFKTKVISASEMDLDTGRREYDTELLQLEIAEEEARLKSSGWFYYLYKTWC